MVPSKGFSIKWAHFLVLCEERSQTRQHYHIFIVVFIVVLKNSSKTWGTNVYRKRLLKWTLQTKRERGLLLIIHDFPLFLKQPSQESLLLLEGLNEWRLSSTLIIICVRCRRRFSYFSYWIKVGSQGQEKDWNPMKEITFKDSSLFLQVLLSLVWEHTSLHSIESTERSRVAKPPGKTWGKTEDYMIRWWRYRLEVSFSR